MKVWFRLHWSELIPPNSFLLAAAGFWVTQLRQMTYKSLKGWGASLPSGFCSLLCWEVWCRDLSLALSTLPGHRKVSQAQQRLQCCSGRIVLCPRGHGSSGVMFTGVCTAETQNWLLEYHRLDRPQPTDTSWQDTWENLLLEVLAHLLYC